VFHVVIFPVLFTCLYIVVGGLSGNIITLFVYDTLIAKDIATHGKLGKHHQNT
jgi:hypothetical protein